MEKIINLQKKQQGAVQSFKAELVFAAPSTPLNLSVLADLVHDEIMRQRQATAASAAAKNSGSANGELK